VTKGGGWNKRASGRPFRKDRKPADRGRAPGPSDPEGLVRLYGTHAVEAALNNPRRTIRRLLATENAEKRLADAITARKLVVERATPLDLDRMLGADAVHQGLLLEAEPLPEPTLYELQRAAADGAPLIILDHVTDPHNAGAVLRSAAVFGAAGVIMTQRHSPPLNGVLAKSASGALDAVPVLLVQNLARTMLELKETGFVLLGLEGTAAARLEEEPFDGKTAIVLGAEGKGLRELTAMTCDRLVSITTSATFTSLNVSNAAAVALHSARVARERRAAPK
jgi:23S rRNA (guanosine2251-2'-O)-methyltransferase